MINIGIVGLGFMAATHIKAYRKIAGARIVAICDSLGKRLDGDFSNVSGNIGAAEPLKLDMTQVAAYKDFDQLLKHPGLEVVDICAPTMAHAELAIAALGAGKHVLCEKPMARTAALANEMVAAVERAPGLFMPAMCIRFWPEWLWLKQAIDDQRFGKILGATFRRVGESPSWGKEHFHVGAQSGGALLDMHIHDVDFVQFCFGKPKKVFATGYSQFSGAIDHVIAQYMTHSGAVVAAEGSWAMARGFGFNMSYTANFEQATVDYDLSRGAESLKVYRKEKAEVISCPGPDGYVGEMSYFLDCVSSQRKPAQVTAQQALVSIQMCEAEEESIRTGLPVSLG